MNFTSVSIYGGNVQSETALLAPDIMFSAKGHSSLQHTVQVGFVLTNTNINTKQLSKMRCVGNLYHIGYMI